MAKKSKLPVSLPTVDYPSTQPMKRTKDDEARERRYKAEDALRAIQRADECRSDKELMRDVKALAKEQMKGLSKIK